MAIRDVLLTLTSYPDPTPAFVVDRAVSLASLLGAHIAAIIAPSSAATRRRFEMATRWV